MYNQEQYDTVYKEVQNTQCEFTTRSFVKKFPGLKRKELEAILQTIRNNDMSLKFTLRTPKSVKQRPIWHFSTS